MKITGIRNQLGSRLTPTKLLTIRTEIAQAMHREGFITEVEMTEAFQIRVGLHMRSFRIDTRRLGYNADVSPWARKRSVKGYVRTSTPTWEQREKFNHIINDVLDAHGITATVRNSAVYIRTREGRINNWDHERFGRLERAYYEIQTEAEVLKERAEESALAALEIEQVHADGVSV